MKIWFYEPYLVINIAEIHDLNHMYTLNIANIDFRRPVRRNACVGIIEMTTDLCEDSENNYYCKCESCDIYGYWRMEPYRVKEKLLQKIKNQ